MHPEGPDVFLFGIPLIALLFFGYFRLDETFTMRKKAPTPPPGPTPVIKQNGRTMGTDPDGRPWEKRAPRRSRKSAKSATSGSPVTSDY